MPLPPIVLPTGICYLIEGHAAEYQSPYAAVDMGTGHRRLRRVSTGRPMVVSISMVLEPDLMTIFHGWFRDSLRSGERSFSARVKAQGPGFLWYEAQWAQMYQAEALAYGRWRVTGALLLTGAGEAEGPELGDLRGEVLIPLTGSGVLTVPIFLRGEVVIPLDGPTLLRGEVVIALEFASTFEDQRVTPEGDDRITPEGDRRVTHG